MADLIATILATSLVTSLVWVLICRRIAKQRDVALEAFSIADAQNDWHARIKEALRRAAIVPPNVYHNVGPTRGELEDSAKRRPSRSQPNPTWCPGPPAGAPAPPPDLSWSTPVDHGSGFSGGGGESGGGGSSDAY